MISARSVERDGKWLTHLALFRLVSRAAIFFVVEVPLHDRVVGVGGAGSRVLTVILLLPLLAVSVALRLAAAASNGGRNETISVDTVPLKEVNLLMLLVYVSAVIYRTCIRADSEPEGGWNSAPPETLERGGSGAGCRRAGRLRRASWTLRKANRASSRNARTRTRSAGM